MLPFMGVSVDIDIEREPSVPVVSNLADVDNLDSTDNIDIDDNLMSLTDRLYLAERTLAALTKEIKQRITAFEAAQETRPEDDRESFNEIKQVLRPEEISLCEDVADASFRFYERFTGYYPRVGG